MIARSVYPLHEDNVCSLLPWRSEVVAGGQRMRMQEARDRMVEDQEKRASCPDHQSISLDIEDSILLIEGCSGRQKGKVAGRTSTH